MRTIFDKLKKKYQRSLKKKSEKIFITKPDEVKEVKKVKKAECKKCKVDNKKTITLKKKKIYGGTRK